MRRSNGEFLDRPARNWVSSWYIARRFPQLVENTKERTKAALKKGACVATRSHSIAHSARTWLGRAISDVEPSLLSFGSEQQQQMWTRRAGAGGYEGAALFGPLRASPWRVDDGTLTLWYGAGPIIDGVTSK